MKIEINEETLKDAIERYGTSAQLDMAIEECSELINSIEKFRRGRVEVKDVVTEIADVQIMCAQLEIIFGGSSKIVEMERARKMDRLRTRLDTPKR